MDDPVAMYLNDVFTVTVNLAGLPGLSVPAGLDANGLPLGLQVIGRAWDEATVFRVGKALEEAAGFSTLPYGLRTRPSVRRRRAPRPRHVCRGLSRPRWTSSVAL